MYKPIFFLVIILLVWGCKEDTFDPFVEDNTASGSMICQINQSTWSADELQAYKERDTLFLKGIKVLAADSNYSSSEINFKIINLNQTDTAEIGEDEFGFIYFVKGNYTLKSAKNLPDVVYTAYFREDNLMTITGINDRSIEAEFKMKVFSKSFSDSLSITNGRLSITY